MHNSIYDFDIRIPKCADNVADFIFLKKSKNTTNTGDFYVLINKRAKYDENIAFTF